MPWITRGQDGDQISSPSRKSEDFALSTALLTPNNFLNEASYTIQRNNMNKKGVELCNSRAGSTRDGSSNQNTSKHFLRVRGSLPEHEAKCEMCHIQFTRTSSDKSSCK